MIARWALRWALYWDHREQVHTIGARLAWVTRDRRAQYERMAAADAAATRARIWRRIAALTTRKTR